jgi:hypothetical protein
MISALHSLQWRIRFTWHGCRRCGFDSLAMWWDWSAADYEQFSHMSTPYEAMREECYAMADSQ